MDFFIALVIASALMALVAVEKAFWKWMLDE